MSDVKQVYGWGDKVWAQIHNGKFPGFIVVPGESPVVSWEQEPGVYFSAHVKVSCLSPRDDGPRPNGWRLPEPGDAIRVIKDDVKYLNYIGREFKVQAIDWEDEYPIVMDDGSSFDLTQIELVRLHDGPEVTEPEGEPKPTTKTTMLTTELNTTLEPPVVVADPKVDTMHDPVHHPSHYRRGGIEVIDFLEAFLTPDQFEGYLLGTQLAYNSRANWKGSMDEDFRKAEWYQKRLVAFREKRKGA